MARASEKSRSCATTTAAAVLALFGGAAPSAAFHSPTELQAWLTYYHREPRPELVVAALVALESELPRHGSTLEAEAARGGMRSFFGRVLAKSPDAVVEVEGHPFAPGTRRFVAEALWRCGTKACAAALGRGGAGGGGWVRGGGVGGGGGGGVWGGAGAAGAGGGRGVLDDFVRRARRARGEDPG